MNRDVASVDEPVLSQVLELRRRHERAVRDLIAEGADQGVLVVETPRVASFGVLEMCVSVARWFSPGGPLTAEQVAEQYSEFALRVAGLVGAPPSQGCSGTGTFVSRRSPSAVPREESGSPCSTTTRRTPMTATTTRPASTTSAGRSGVPPLAPADRRRRRCRPAHPALAHPHRRSRSQHRRGRRLGRDRYPDDPDAELLHDPEQHPRADRRGHPGDRPRPGRTVLAASCGSTPSWASPSPAWSSTWSSSATSTPPAGSSSPPSASTTSPPGRPCSGG